MVDLPIGRPTGGIAGIPAKYLLIGAGGLVLAFVLLRQSGSQGGSATPQNGAVGGYGSALGPNAALALGGVQQSLLEQSGEVQKQLRDAVAGLTGQGEREYAQLGRMGEYQRDALAAIIAQGGDTYKLIGQGHDYAANALAALIGQGNMLREQIGAGHGDVGVHLNGQAANLTDDTFPTGMELVGPQAIYGTAYGAGVPGA